MQMFGLIGSLNSAQTAAFAWTRRKSMAECKDCIHWRLDTDPETGAEVHVCCNNASPRLDDLTEGSDHCGYWQADA